MSCHISYPTGLAETLNKSCAQETKTHSTVESSPTFYITFKHQYISKQIIQKERAYLGAPAYGSLTDLACWA